MDASTCQTSNKQSDNPIIQQGISPMFRGSWPSFFLSLSLSSGSMETCVYYSLSQCTLRIFCSTKVLHGRSQCLSVKSLELRKARFPQEGVFAFPVFWHEREICENHITKIVQGTPVMFVTEGTTWARFIMEGTAKVKFIVVRTKVMLIMERITVRFVQERTAESGLLGNGERSLVLDSCTSKCLNIWVFEQR